MVFLLRVLPATSRGGSGCMRPVMLRRSMSVYMTVKLCWRKGIWEYTVRNCPCPRAVRVSGSRVSIQTDVVSSRLVGDG